MIASWHRFVCDFGRLWEPNRDGESTKIRSKKTSKLKLFFESVFSSFWSPFGMHVGGQVGEKTSGGAADGAADGASGGAVARFHEMFCFSLQAGLVFVPDLGGFLDGCFGIFFKLGSFLCQHVGGQVGEKTSAGAADGREGGRAGGATVRFHEICWYFLQVGFVFVSKSIKKRRFCVGFWWAEF